VAPDRDADTHVVGGAGCVHGVTHVVGQFPLLGFAGDRGRRVRDREKRGNDYRQPVGSKTEVKSVLF